MWNIIQSKLLEKELSHIERQEFFQDGMVSKHEI